VEAKDFRPLTQIQNAPAEPAKKQGSQEEQLLQQILKEIQSAIGALQQDNSNVAQKLEALRMIKNSLKVPAIDRVWQQCSP